MNDYGTASIEVFSGSGQTREFLPGFKVCIHYPKHHIPADRETGRGTWSEVAHQGQQARVPERLWGAVPASRDEDH